MKKETLKCYCSENKKCSAPLHGEIEIITCEKNCGLDCNKPLKNPRKYE